MRVEREKREQEQPHEADGIDASAIYLCFPPRKQCGMDQTKIFTRKEDSDFRPRSRFCRFPGPFQTGRFSIGEVDTMSQKENRERLLPDLQLPLRRGAHCPSSSRPCGDDMRSEEHTSELQSRGHL